MEQFNIYMSAKVDSLFDAFANAQSKFKKPAKSAKNPHFKNVYSTMEDIWEAIREPLAENGLIVFQTLGYRDGISLLVTTLGHRCGQFIRGEAALLMSKADAQSMGSAISYMKRYSLSALIGVGCDDGCEDDGEATTHRPEPAYAGKRIALVKENQIEPQLPAFPTLSKKVEAKGLNIEYLNEFINYRATETGKSFDQVVNSALLPALFDKFCTAYGNHMAEQWVSI